MTTRLGIDEAGRGCVLGPMIYGGCLVELAHEPALFAAGVRDSKRLSARRRDELLATIHATALARETIAFAPEELDRISLNELGKRAIVDLVVRHAPDVLVFDAPVPPRQIPGYLSDLRARLRAAGARADLEIIGENGADDRYACCAAASILAKTTRDAALAALQAQCDAAMGSGYPSDEVTVVYLEGVWAAEGRFPSWVRTKWATAGRIASAGGQRSLF